MNGGFCRDFGSGLNCSCSDAYTGIGCQYEFDACAAGVCQNGATCIDDGNEYECICPRVTPANTARRTSTTACRDGVRRPPLAST